MRVRALTEDRKVEDHPRQLPRQIAKAMDTARLNNTAVI